MINHYSVGGESNQEEIIFSSYNYYIKIRTFPKIEIGDVKPLRKGKVSKTEVIFWTVFIMLSLGEILHRYMPLQIGNMVSNISYIFRMMAIIFLIGSITFMLKSGIKSFDNLRTNHGAEHKVICAYNAGNIEYAQKFERFSVACGSYLAIPIIIIIVLGGWIYYPFTICLLYYAGYTYVGTIRYVLFRTIGIPIQYMVTKEPVPEILNAAKEGLSRLINEEETRHIAKWVGEIEKRSRNRLEKDSL